MCRYLIGNPEQYSINIEDLHFDAEGKKVQKTILRNCKDIFKDTANFYASFNENFNRIILFLSS